jgi:hypothetical protein
VGYWKEIQVDLDLPSFLFLFLFQTSQIDLYFAQTYRGADREKTGATIEAGIVDLYMKAG